METRKGEALPSREDAQRELLYRELAKQELKTVSPSEKKGDNTKRQF